MREEKAIVLVSLMSLWKSFNNSRHCFNYIHTRCRMCVAMGCTAADVMLKIDDCQQPRKVL